MTGTPGESFATLTHARLRAAQGDVAGAARILRVILAVQPAHQEAQAFLEDLTRRAPAPAGAARATRLGRLTAWLERAQANRGARGVR